MKSKLPLYLNRFGFFKGLALYFLLKSKRKRVVRIRIPQVKHPIFVRLGTSDRNVFNNIFVYGEYDAVELGFAPTNFLDGGGNIGLAAVYFANRYPQMQILSVEPESENFKILQQNIAAYETIRAVKAGLWSRPTHLEIRDAGGGEWGFTVEETDTPTPGSVRAESIEGLIQQNGGKPFDVVKLDIEGSESEVFRTNTELWLPTVQVLVVELHEWMKPGSSASFLAATSAYSYRKTSAGEYDVYVRQDVTA
ncbi:FkbM family methyltransferase [Larkinella humicola]|uniref:FkbM family methyltransferase n=1 Tax=Larkinella humicola TaxID=2607654 RepID=A0A5N1JB51_9BACT|nr:FkbM family methyltransferase [Larkinella humicola]KAA9349004.1 FkbM family methyltransferase [Larkinella humicola]